MSARKSDPVIGAWDRLRAANKAHSHAYKELDKATGEARRAGFNILRPVVRIAGNDCIMIEDARRSARRLPKAEATRAIEAMRTALAAWQMQRRKAGLTRFEASEKRAMRDWRAAMQAMATTRATTSMGVILKLRLIARELRDGETGFGEDILASAISDLSRIGGKRKAGGR